LSAALADCVLDAEKTLTLDAEVELARISADLLATIQRLAPFGAGNPPVQLGSRGLRLVDEATFGKSGQHKRLVVRDEANYEQEVIWWGGAAEASPQGRFDLAFTLGPDEYQGGDSLRLTWLAAREWAPTPIAAAPEFIDWRQEKSLPKIHAVLTGLRQGNLKSRAVWAEGIALPNLPAKLRHQLRPAEALVIWTAPPGQDIFQQAMQVVKPRQVYLVGEASPLDTLPAFIRQLMGLVKYALTNKEGEVDLPALAASLGHRVTTVRLGVDWLAAQGKLKIYAEEDDLLVLRADQRQPSTESNNIEAMLIAALAETAAYRRFFRETSLGVLAKQF
jgi:single-stranded-DNA-specific exonuclease